MRKAGVSDVLLLETLLDQRRVWRGQLPVLPPSSQPTVHAALDAALPAGGWPPAALSEMLSAGPGRGELQLLWPALFRSLVLVAPPHLPYPPAWQAAGVDLRWLSVIRASASEGLWAAEQCLRSGSCAAVLCWPQQVDDRALRRLQVAAETGQCLAFACRPLQAALNPSPAALRLVLDGPRGQVRVLKCRGGLAPSTPILFSGQ